MKRPMVLPNRNDKRQDAAENQREPEVVRRLRKIGRLGPGHAWQAIEELDDGKAEADQRNRGPQHRHQRAFDAQPRAQPAEMRICRSSDFEPIRNWTGLWNCHDCHFLATDSLAVSLSSFRFAIAVPWR